MLRQFRAIVFLCLPFLQCRCLDGSDLKDAIRNTEQFYDFIFTRQIKIHQKFPREPIAETAVMKSGSKPPRLSADKGSLAVSAP